VNAIRRVASTRLWKLCVYQIAIHVFTPDSSKIRVFAVEIPIELPKCHQ